MADLLKKLDVLKGWKTQIAGIGLLVLALSEFLDGKNDLAVEHALEGVGLIGISFKIERSKS